MKNRVKLPGLLLGKLSTLFNAYLEDFVESMDKDFSSGRKEMNEKIKELERRTRKIEENK